MRTRLAHVLAATVLITLLGGTAAAGAPAPARSDSPAAAQVAVSVTVAPALESTFTSDGVVVRSNVPWVVSASTAAGERMVVTGEPTGGEYVALPDAAGPIDVCAR